MIEEEILEHHSMIYDEIQYALNGGELKNIEVSREENVLPTGSYHKDKHEDFGLGETHKGITVGHIQNGNSEKVPETLEEIKLAGGEFIQDCEIERMEVIFSKETTDFLEENRKEWNKSHDKDIALEVGKRITKELLFNTKDNAGIIENINDKLA